MERVTDDRGTASRTVAIVCFFPWAFVFSMTYSEGLLLAAACGCLLCLIDRRWLLAGLCAAAAGVARPNGFVLVLPCAWAGGLAAWRGRSLRPLLAPLVSPLGILAFFVFLQVRAGDFLANIHVKDQAFGGQGIGLDLRSAGPHFSGFFKNPLGDLNFVTSWVSLAIVLGAVALVVRPGRGGWRPPVVFWLYAVPVVLLAFWFTSFGSTPRFVMTAFPFLAVYAARLRGTAFSVVLACSAVLMGVLMVFAGTTILFTP
jgi:hypothetical protein